MKTKKIMAVLLASCMLLSVAACNKGGEETTAPSETEAPTTTTEATTTESMEEETAPSDFTEDTVPDPLNEGIQMDIIVDNFEKWLHDEGEDADKPYLYAVTDLNNNGMLEVINCVVEGSGLYTYANIFEVTEDLELTEFAFPQSEQEGAPDIPDIGVESLNYFVVGGEYIYVVTDNIRISSSESVEVTYAMKFDEANKKMSLEKLGYAENKANKKGDIESKCFDKDDKEISEEDYYKLGMNLYSVDSSEMGAAMINWITQEQMQQEDFEVLLHESWDGFQR
ncbi:MAG: hypothetical protein J6X33_03455 [Clostridiales bacterium]|nr:hypothetical protein [Clostridiales bacterium]